MSSISTTPGEVNSVAPPTMDANLEKLVESIIEKKIDERFSSIDDRIAQALKQLKPAEGTAQEDRVTMVCHSGDFDRLMAVFIIAAGAVAMGMEVSIFFTFWGLNALKKKTTYAGKSITEKMVGMMMPSSVNAVGTSRLNMMGMGPAFFQSLMKKNNVQTLPELIDLAKELGCKFIACQMSMGIMGITKEELTDDIEYGGVAAYLGDASDSKVTLFI